MPNKVKNWRILPKIATFASFGMELKKVAKIYQNEKMQHFNGYFQKINMTEIFRIFYFLSLRSKEKDKKKKKCDFLKICDFC